MYTTLKCKDCNGDVLFNAIGSGSQSKVHHISYCVCSDRTSSKSKIMSGDVIFKLPISLIIKK